MLHLFFSKSHRWLIIGTFILTGVCIILLTLLSLLIGHLLFAS